MAETKILNVDALVKNERIITLKGVQHKQKELSVADFIKINNMAEKADAIENPTLIDRINFLIDSILVSFPTADRDTLMEHSFEDLNYIAAFARDGSLPDDAQVSEVDGKK